MRQIWMMSNQQPWTEALLRGIITCKTRRDTVHLPPVGAIVLLHASTTLWSGYQSLIHLNRHIRSSEVPNLPRGGVCGIAVVKSTGDTIHHLPLADQQYFELSSGCSCAGPRTIIFDHVQRVRFVECRGTQQPTRKLPKQAIESHGVLNAISNILATLGDK